MPLALSLRRDNFVTQRNVSIVSGTESTNAAEAQIAAAMPARRRLWLLVASVMTVLAALGGGWWWNRTQAPQASAPAPVLPLLYLAIDPPFVTNVAGDGASRLLQVSVSVSTRSPETLELMKSNLPMLRDALLMRFAAQEAGALATLDGKENLRTAVKADVRRVVAAAGGRGDSIVAVLFDGFVVQ